MSLETASLQPPVLEASPLSLPKTRRLPKGPRQTEAWIACAHETTPEAGGSPLPQPMLVEHSRRRF